MQNLSLKIILGITDKNTRRILLTFSGPTKKVLDTVR